MESLKEQVDNFSNKITKQVCNRILLYEITLLVIIAGTCYLAFIKQIPDEISFEYEFLNLLGLIYLKEIVAFLLLMIGFVYSVIMLFRYERLKNYYAIKFEQLYFLVYWNTDCNKTALEKEQKNIHALNSGDCKNDKQETDRENHIKRQKEITEVIKEMEEYSKSFILFHLNDK